MSDDLRANTVVGGANVIRLYWAIRPNGLVYGPVTKVPTNHPADWVIIHTDGIPEERDAS